MVRDTLKIVIIGHVDHGKSTLIGRLLLDTNSLPKEKISEIKKISRELGKDTELAYLTDQLKEEREKNITIDTTQIFFKTKKRDFVIIDAPGHVEFLKNMITGATQAEAAVLMVDVNEGMMEQTGRHAYITGMLGMERIIILFNKMDLVGYNEQKFNNIKDELLKFMQNLGVEPVFMIPVSAKEGDNISKKSSKMSWYKGPILLEALDSLKMKAKIENRPLRYPVQDIYEVNRKKIVVGRVESGIVKKGREITIFPSGQKARINSIEIFGGHKTDARAGESIGLTLSESMGVKRGDIIAYEEKPPKLVSRFRGNVFWMSEEPLQVEKPITLRCATQEIECIAEKIERRINSSTLEILEEDAKELKLNEAGVVIFKAEKPIVAEKFSFIEGLGRFVIEREYSLQGAGIIAT